MSRQMLSAADESFSSRYRSAFCNAAGIPSFVIGFNSIRHLVATRTGPSRASFRFLPSRIDLHELADRIEELVNDAFLEWNDRVVGDRDVLRTYLRAALRDVAVADPVFLAQLGDAVGRIE